MTSVAIRISSLDHEDGGFSWYEVYGSKTNHALVDVVANATWNDLGLQKTFIHANLTAGDTWYYWSRAIYNRGDTAGDLAALGSLTIGGPGLAAVAYSGSASDLTTGTLPVARLPAVALTDVWVVASQAAQLALTVEEGDVAIRSDQNRSYIHNGGVAGTMADWSELTAAGLVASVAGKTGTVTLVAADISDSTAAGRSLLTAADAAAQATILGASASLVQNLNAGRPAFSAYASADIANVTGDATVYTVALNTEDYDIGGNFASNTFTAPVAGKYRFSASVGLKSTLAGHTYGFVRISTSGGKVRYIWLGDWSGLATSSDDAVVSGSTTISLTASETVTLEVAAYNSAKDCDLIGSADHMTMFAGELIL